MSSNPSIISKLSLKKKSVHISIAIGIALLVGISVIVFFSPQEPILLTFLEYQPLRAKLKLTNNSSKTITYLTDDYGGAALTLPKTSAGWTNSSRELFRGTMMDGLTGKTTPFYIYADPGFMTNGRGGDSKSLYPNNLKPGLSAEVYAWLQADGSAIRVGTVCIVPQGKLAEQIGRWLNRIKRWCRMKTTPPGIVEVWCSQPLKDPSSLRSGTNWYDL